MNISNRIDKLIQTQPEDETATLLAQLRELNISRQNPNLFYQTRPLVKEFSDNYFARYKLKPSHKFFYPAVSKGEYALQTVSPISYLMKLVRPETEAIVELGSGWSCNLFQQYVGLGRTRCKEIDFIGAEYTDAGRECARKIANFDGHIRYHDFPMDYRKPDTSFLQKYKKHILVFTHHSIEQVDKIDHRLYQQLSELDAQVTLCHFEPIGWQRSKPLMDARKNNDTDYFVALGEKMATSLETEQDQMDNAAWWSWRLKYNHNLTSITNRYTRSGQVRLAFRAYDFGGIGNVLNPTTLYHLEFLK